MFVLSTQSNHYQRPSLPIWVSSCSFTAVSGKPVCCLDVKMAGV